MLVVINLTELRLAYTFDRCVPIDLGQHTDLDAPVAREPVHTRQIHAHREFAGKRVSKTVEVLQQSMIVQDGPEGPQQRCHEQTRDAAIHPVGVTGIKTLTELETEVGIYHGI